MSLQGFNSARYHKVSAMVRVSSCINRPEVVVVAVVMGVEVMVAVVVAVVPVDGESHQDDIID